LTRNQTYYDAFGQTLDFVAKHQVAAQGSWWASRAADGSSGGDRTRTGPWQGGYHAGRAMMLCAKKLQVLAQAPDGL
jgi:mannose/cellobiose epimerase-like protein (N-acyl-D-glucosamine 2-epimerase family)